MNALAHYPSAEWVEKALRQPSLQVGLRALVAAGPNSPANPATPADAPAEIERILGDAMAAVGSQTSVEDRLDLLRVLALYQGTVRARPEFKMAVERHLLSGLHTRERDLQWEHIRLLGQFQVGAAFGPLLQVLSNEKDEVTQFHLAQSLAPLPTGWTSTEEEAALDWFVAAQQGWFAETDNKGVEFPQFWAATVSEFAARHREAVLRRAPHIRLASALGTALIGLLGTADPTGGRLIELYRNESLPAARINIAIGLREVRHTNVAAFLRTELATHPPSTTRAALWSALATQPVDPGNVPGLIEGLDQGTPEVAGACAVALRKHQAAATESLAKACLERMTGSSRLARSCEELLKAVSGRRRADDPGPTEPNRRLEEAERRAMTTFWQGWYAVAFGHPFVSRASSRRERSDEEVRQFLLSDASKGGSAARGAIVYDRLQCHICHSGGVAPGREGRIFGPDLAGVTRRLSRVELAEALVYPSRQVADRFKGFELERKDGTVLTGFVTGRDEEGVTFADQQQVHRIGAKDIVRLVPQTKSLMPEHLLNALTDGETQDLLAFLEMMGVTK